MKVRIDKRKCCECSLCTKTAEEVFYIGKKGVLVNKNFPETDEVIQKIKIAAEECPKQAIRIIN